MRNNTGPQFLYGMPNENLKDDLLRQLNLNGLLRFTAWRLQKQTAKEKHEGRMLLALGHQTCLSFTGNA